MTLTPGTPKIEREYLRYFVIRLVRTDQQNGDLTEVDAERIARHSHARDGWHFSHTERVAPHIVDVYFN